MSEQKPASSTRGGKGRWSARRKVSVVLEQLRGADLESLSRPHGVTAATLSNWREHRRAPQSRAATSLRAGAAHHGQRESVSRAIDAWATRPTSASISSDRVARWRMPSSLQWEAARRILATPQSDHFRVSILL
jgi:hypothetical protein